MSDYIEDRINKLEIELKELTKNYRDECKYLESRTDRIEHLEEAVEDLKEQMNILADDYKIFRQEDYTDQPTEEFVKVVRCGECVCYDEEKKDYCELNL